MPLWSVEEWRARIGSSWAALGRPVGRSSYKERRYFVYYSPGGGGVVLSQDCIILMVTILAFFMLLMASLIILLPLKAECSQCMLDGPSSAYYPGRRYISHIFEVLWNKVLLCDTAKQLNGVLLPKDLLASVNSVRPDVCIIGALAIADVGPMELKISPVADSLLLRCGDIEMNPGPLGREDLEKVDNSRILSEADFREVYLELATMKANYHQLGTVLGLPAGELQVIQQTLSQNVEQAFTQVLLLWLRQHYHVEKYGLPTWRRLVEAVDNNNHALAKKITERHIASTTGSMNHPCSHSASQQPVRQPHPNTPQLPEISGSNTSGSGVPSGASAGYTTPPIPHYVYNQDFGPTAGLHSPWMCGATQFQPFYRPPYYQPAHPLGYTAPQNTWQYGGHIYSNFPHGYNPYNPVDNATSFQILVQGNVQSPPSKKFKRSPSAEPPIGQIQLSANTLQLLHHWRQKLASSYLAEESKSDAWPPLKIIQFVQLALVQQEKHLRHLNLHTIENDIDEVYGHKININYGHLFTKLDHSSLLLIEGRPGSGKTTLLVRISCDWAKGKILKSKIVIFVRLRHLDKTKEVNLYDLLRIASCALSPEDISGLSSYIEGRYGEDVVFILDGFDEYGIGADEDNFICNLVSRKVFSRSNVILSSRPAATQAFREIATQWIEVVGFMKEQVMQYIHTYFEHNKEKGVQLEKHLSEHPNVMNLCYLPLYSAMLMFLYEEDSFLPETETEFYRHFTLSSLVRGIRKNTRNVSELISFNDLPSKEKSYFGKVCHLAFQATVKTQQVFKKSELPDIVCFSEGSVNDKENPGLLVIDRYFVKYGLNETYSFLHLTLQEYLSAVYIAGCDDDKQVEIITSHRNRKHLHVTWRFLFGILDYSKRSTVNLFKLLLVATCNCLVFHVHCAYESHHKSACNDVVQFHKNNLLFREISLSAFDVTCITYVLKNAEYTTIELIFVQCGFSFDDAKILLKGVSDHQLSLIVHAGKAVQSVLDALSLVSVTGLIELDLCGSGITDDAGAGGMGMKTNPKHGTNLRRLVLFDGAYGAGATGVGVINNLKHSTNLKRLRLDRIDITNFGLEEGFEYWTNLQLLHIWNTSCPLTVLDAIKHCTNLVELNLGLCCLNDIEACRVFGESLKFISKLHSIDLSANKFSDCGLQALSESVKNDEELKKFVLDSVRLTDKSIPCLTEFINSARNLETLNIEGNQFTPRGKERLSETVRERNSVRGATKLELLI